MTDVELARAIATAVDRRGGHTFYVGGFVRDHMLGREGKDVDIEVHGIEIAELERLLSTFGALEAFGASFGVYGLRGHALDIAVPRKRGVCGGSEDIATSADPFVGVREAARRRDITINALYEDVLTGEVVDCFGGLDDLSRGIIRHVDAETFSDDPLRVVRVAQFAARLGMSVASETMGLCRGIDLAGVAPERVLGELRKALLMSDVPSTFFCYLREMGQLDTWFSEVEALVGVPQNPAYHPEGDVWEHAMLVLDAAAGLAGRASDSFCFMLAALCHDFGKATTTELHHGRIVSYGHETAGVPLADAFLARLRAGDASRRYVRNMVELHMAPNAYVAQGSGRKAYNRLFDRSCCPRDLLLLAQADSLGRGGGLASPGPVDELAARLVSFEDLMARPYVRGEDLLAYGVEPGPEMGEALRFAHKLRLAGLDKDQQLRQALAYWHSLPSRSV